MEDKERAENTMGGAEAATVSKSEDNTEQQDIKIWVSLTEAIDLFFFLYNLKHLVFFTSFRCGKSLFSVRFPYKQYLSQRVFFNSLNAILVLFCPNN